MSERDYAPLSIACVRGLCDKLYEKRKFAGVEIEKMVKDFNEANNTSQIKRLLRVLGQDLMASTNPNVKNGALMGLSSVAVGLGKGCVPYLEQLVLPAAACCGEGESRVRYQAAEALYNVAKIARGAALQHFPLLFDALAALAADPEPQVRHAAELLDRLVKDIVTESEEFDVRLWVPLVRERLYARAAGARQFAVSWLAVLDAAPAAALAQHLPELLDGLFRMLDDPNPEIRRMCEVQLSEFLRSVRAAPERADAPAMLNVLITHAQAPEDLVQLTALRWVSVLVGLPGGERRALPFASGALAAALPALAYTDEPRKAIRETATTLNSQLLKLVTDMPTALEGNDSKAEGDSEAPEGGNSEGAEGASGLQLEAVVAVLSQLLHHSSVHTKVAALDWFLHLYNRMPNEMRGCSETVFSGAVSALALPAADDVARRALAVLAEICSAHAEHGSLESSPYYRRFLSALLRLLAADDALMEDRGAFIIRQVCVLVGAEAAYAALAELVAAETDLRFAAAAAALLGQILLTAAELYDLRQHLRQYSPDSSAPRLLSRLYPCWSHSPVALLALCLLTGNYRHCNRLINTFGDLEITVDFLTEVDKLVQLIESPIFAFLRLELLRPDAGGRRLRGCLRGLLMLLPQTDAFHTLRRRLQCVPPPKHDHEDSDSEEEPEWAERLQLFREVQCAHRRDRMLDRGHRLIAPHGFTPQP